MMAVISVSEQCRRQQSLPVVFIQIVFVVSLGVVVTTSNNSNDVVDEIEPDVDSKLSVVVASSNKSDVSGTERHRKRLCEPVPQDVLWKRLKSVGPRFSAVDDDEDRGDDDNYVDSKHDDIPDNSAKNTTSFQVKGEVQGESQTSSVRAQDHAGFGQDGGSTPKPNSLSDADDPSLNRLRRHSTWKADGKRRHGGQRSQTRTGRWRRRKHSNHRRLRSDKVDRQPINGQWWKNDAQRASWHCRYEKRWKRMPAGTFPAYIQTGTCRHQSTCMLGLYECRPRRYRIKILQRLVVDAVVDTETTGSSGGHMGCNPLPNIGSETRYEEVWHFIERKVTVGCDCSRKRVIGNYWRVENG